MFSTGCRLALSSPAPSGLASGRLPELNRSVYVENPQAGGESDAGTGIHAQGTQVRQVFAGGRDVFLRDGFEGASVDEIAREAGVSKATLYSYFPDKRLLFVEVATAQCKRQADEELMTMDLSRPPRIVLRQAAITFLGFTFSDMGQRIFRICVAESDRFPELGREFYRCGPQTVHAALVDYLGAARD